MKKRISTLVCFVFLLIVTKTNAQEEKSRDSNSGSFYEMSLEQLMNVEVTIATQTAQTPRESSGILTVITAEEIKKSGAQELIEVLKMVPGFDFGVDVEGVLGIAVRGNWAHEGKVLLLLDGHELNEDLYSTVQFGGHYPIDQIKRIEIIRGPGSAVYGGNAEYAVINIITICQQDLEGIQVSTSAGQMSKTFSQRQLSLATGKKFGKSYLGFSTQQVDANRSQQNYIDNTGAAYDMTQQSPIHTSQYTLNFNHEGFTCSGFIDRYHLGQRDGYDNVLSKTDPTNFDSYYALASYDCKINKKLVLTPGFRFKSQEPWKYVDDSPTSEFFPYHVRVKKSDYYLTANYQASRSLDIIGGAEYYTQYASQLIDTGLFRNGEKNFFIRNFSANVQSVYKNPIANLTLGTRFNYNNSFPSSFVPRVGITRVMDAWHFKFLYSRAFRTPSIENVNYNSSIKPENTEVKELEAGVRAGRNTYLTLNLFDITTKDVIIYYYEVDNLDAYKNEGQTGTKGAEVEYKIKTNDGYLKINYSFYSASGKTQVSNYSVPGKPSLLLGFPAHRINVDGNLRLDSRININPSVTFQSSRYSTYNDTGGNPGMVRKFGPAMYANLAFNFENILVKRMDLQLACFNMFDQEIYYIQPYNSNHAPLPGASREFRIKLSYNFNFNQ